MVSPDTLTLAISSSPRRRLRWLVLICCAIAGTSLVGYGSFAPRSRVVPIVDVKLGDNVVAQHPQGVVDRSLGDVVDPANWRQIDLDLKKEDGSPAKIRWLRPLSWFYETFGVNEHAGPDGPALVGRSLLIDIPEFGLVGEARVTRVLPCPPIQPGNGSPVIGRFEHASQDVLDLYVSRESTPLATTKTHPFWSETRQDFVAAIDLRLGERLRTLHGVQTVERMQPRPGQHTVYNLEIFGEHVYSVGSLGIIVHNENGPAGTMRRRLDRLGYDEPHADAIMDAIKNGENVVVIGENINRVGAAARMVEAAGGKPVVYKPRSFLGLNRNSLEANRSWLRYWAKDQGTPVLNVGPQPTPRLSGPSPFYALENRSLYNWRMYSPFPLPAN